MEGNAENGKKLTVTIGVYIVLKQLLNWLIGGILNLGGMVYLIIAVVAAFFLLTGFKPMKYIVAIGGLILFVVNIAGNLSNLSLTSLIYLAEGVIDVIAAIILLTNADVKAFFDTASN